MSLTAAGVFWAREEGYGAEFVGVLLPEDDPSSSCKLMPCASAMSPYLFNATSGGSGPPPAAHHFPRFSTVRAQAAQAERNRTDHESIRFRRFRETHVPTLAWVVEQLPKESPQGHKRIKFLLCRKQRRIAGWTCEARAPNELAVTDGVGTCVRVRG